MKMQRDNLLYRIFLLYAAVRSNIANDIQIVLKDMDDYVLKISFEELSYWT